MNVFQSLVRRYAATSMARPLIPLAALLLVTVLAGWLATGLELETDLKHLLPDDAPSVVALNEARERTAGSDQFLVSVHSRDALANVRFVDDLTELFGQWEAVEGFENEQDQSFYREHALLLLPVTDLLDIKSKLQRLIRRRLGQNNPLFIDLETEDDNAEAQAAGLDPADEENERRWRDITYWIPDSTLVELGQSPEEAQRMFSFAPREEVDPDAASDPNALPPMLVHRDELPEQYQDYRLSAAGRVVLMVARLDGRATDVEFAREAFERATAAIAQLDPSSYAPDMRAEVAGSYRGFLEIKSVTDDMQFATTLSLGLVFIILVVFFRSLRSVMIVMSPLLMGIVWTAGLMDVLYGRLSTLTAFVFAMLIGMGIDFAIHLYGRAREEWAAGATWEEAIFVAITRTGRALLTATMTTVVSLLMLTFASFDGFVEFGVACAAGVSICLLSTTLLVPPLIGISEKVWTLSRPAPRATGASSNQPAAGRSVLPLRVLTAVTVVGVIASVAVAGRAEFEYDFSQLRGPGTGSTINYGSAIGSRRGSTPVVILGDDENQMREVHAILRERAGVDSMLKSFITIETLVPADQQERMEVINDIYEVLDRRAVQNIDGDEGELIAQLTEMTDTEPFTADDLPD